MAVLNLPGPFARVDELAEEGNLLAAREVLSQTQGSPLLRELCEVKIALLEGTLAPQLAMNRLLAVMRQDGNVPGAHDLYREASQMSYQSGSSSMSHSHPPPPMKPSDEG